MKELVEDLIKSRLKEEQYPFLSDINQPSKKYEILLCLIIVVNITIIIFNKINNF